MDSFMFQTVGHEAIDALSIATQLPLFRAILQGTSKQTSLHYTGEGKLE